MKQPGTGVQVCRHRHIHTKALFIYTHVHTCRDKKTCTYKIIHTYPDSSHVQVSDSTQLSNLQRMHISILHMAAEILFVHTVKTVCTNSAVLCSV